MKAKKVKCIWAGKHSGKLEFQLESIVDAWAMYMRTNTPIGFSGGSADLDLLDEDYRDGIIRRHEGRNYWSKYYEE